MDTRDSVDINRLILLFADLQEQWESDPGRFDWRALQALARKGASAYNDGAGPSFHALVLDGVPPGEFHERFLRYSLDAGFDPFHLVQAGASPNVARPALDHEGLANAARTNPVAGRMHALLLDNARTRFAPLLAQAQQGDAEARSVLYPIFAASAESIPADLLEQIAPELTRSHDATGAHGNMPPEEGYLAPPESIIDSSRPRG